MPTCSGDSVTTTSASRSSSTARTVSRPGSPGPLPTKDTHPRGATPDVLDGDWLWLRVMPAASSLVLPSGLRRRRRASRSRGGGRRRRRRRRGPVALIRTERPPSWESATARTHSSSPSSPSTTSARAPSGAEQPASSVASTARSAVDRRPGGAGRRARRRLGHEVGVVGAALDRERTLPGGGEHLQRVEHLGGLVERGRGGRARRGPAARRRTRRWRPCRCGCPRCRGRRRRRGRGRGPRAGRRGAGSRCRRGCRAAARRGSGRRGRRRRRAGPRGWVRRPARCRRRGRSAGP